jgi:hypothetical protein
MKSDYQIAGSGQPRPICFTTKHAKNTKEGQRKVTSNTVESVLFSTRRGEGAKREGLKAER